MTEATPKTEQHGRILVLKISNPPKLNAWTTAHRDVIRGILKDAATNDAIGAVVITGEGDRAFCAGQDLEEAARFTDSSWVTEMESLYDRLRRFPKPVVAALNGVAAGSGFQLALLCDIRVGWSGSRMGQTELNHDIPSITGTWLMAHEVGMARTRALVLLGKVMTGDEAYRYGFIDEFVPSREEVLPRAIELAEQLASRDSVAFRTTKDWIRTMSEDGFHRAFEEARARHLRAFEGGAAQVGIKRFLDKTP